MGTKNEYEAAVYSYDVTNDLAILITDHLLSPLATIQPGNEVHVGQWVMAVGSPGAGDTTLDGSITTGTITNIKEGVIITDTTINPGNSGGAPDAVLEGVTGICVDGTDVDQVAQAIVDICADAKRASNMGSAGRNWIVDQWRWEIWSSEFNALLVD
jgi:hypothetical protein